MLKTLIAFAAGTATAVGIPTAWRFVARRSNTQVHRVRR